MPTHIAIKFRVMAIAHLQNLYRKTGSTFSGLVDNPSSIVIHIEARLCQFGLYLNTINTQCDLDSYLASPNASLMSSEERQIYWLILANKAKINERGSALSTDHLRTAKRHVSPKTKNTRGGDFWTHSSLLLPWANIKERPLVACVRNVVMCHRAIFELRLRT